MNLLTDFVLNESQKTCDVISSTELTRYISKVGNTLPKSIQALLVYCKKYDILSCEELQRIINASKSELGKIAVDHNMTTAEITDFQKLLKEAMSNKTYRLIPMYQTPKEREEFMLGKKGSEDVTLDLETEKGRNEVAKKYMPLVMAIATKFIGKSSLGKNELMSAGALGLADAINDYRKPDEYIDTDEKVTDKKEAKDVKHLTFKQYAGWRIRNAILYDINHLSRTVKIGQYGYEKNKKEGRDELNWEVSIERDFDNNETMLSKFADLADDCEDKTTNKQWKQIYDILNKNFSSRDLTVFYKYFGLNGYDKEKGIDIAKEFNITSSRISGLIKKIMSFLKDDPKTKALLNELVNIYAESILVDNIGKNKEEILEAFAMDDIYILLEDITRWENKTFFMQMLYETLSSFSGKDKDVLKRCVTEGFNYVDSIYRSQRKLIIAFLEKMYPTETFNRKSDVYILDRFVDIIDAAQKWKVDIRNI